MLHMNPRRAAIGLALLTLAALAPVSGAQPVADSPVENAYDVNFTISDGLVDSVAAPEGWRCEQSYDRAALGSSAIASDTLTTDSRTGADSFTLTIRCLPEVHVPPICYRVDVWGYARTSGVAVVAGTTFGSCFESPVTDCSAASALGVPTFCFNTAVGAGLAPYVCIARGVGAAAGTGSGSYSYSGSCRFYFV